MRAFPNLMKRLHNCGAALLLIVIAISSVSQIADAKAAPKTHMVVIEAMQFSPQVLEVRPGDTVVWVNKDAFPHNAVANDHSFRSKEIAPNSSWKFKAVKKGTFAYICTLHPSMKASLMVK